MDNEILNVWIMNLKCLDNFLLSVKTHLGLHDWTSFSLTSFPTCPFSRSALATSTSILCFVHPRHTPPWSLALAVSSAWNTLLILERLGEKG